MIKVCRQCLPPSMHGYGNPYGIFEIQCDVCGKPHPGISMTLLDCTVEDVRYANWCHEFEEGRVA